MAPKTFLELKIQKVKLKYSRLDRILFFGATFMVLAPEHALVEGITTEEQKNEVQKYIDYVSSRSG